MASVRSSFLIFSFVVLLLVACDAGAQKSRAPENLVRSSCIHASYPKVCIRTLSAYPGPARTPYDLARKAVSVSHNRARKTSKYLAQVKAQKWGSKKAKAALRDCLEQLSDSAAELSDTLKELGQLRSGSFRWRMNNAETWVSAALTDEDTCLDGIGEIRGGGSDSDLKVIKTDVRRRIKNVAKVTSNALYLINRLDASRGKP
ncbi:hypothetical protein Nepgr_015615 [Nepenthes gracilis]|uniref:Pectinesterase inhibitor domain-containing protein n=1 Tax=Nepenthes gracilis TaxID=150966 RepID=A0AAD3SN41_NEPGR|nr:hypothetical protein Nepgr_015615 [Nepenthes gracilis]